MSKEPWFETINLKRLSEIGAARVNLHGNIENCNKYFGDFFGEDPEMLVKKKKNIMFMTLPEDRQTTAIAFRMLRMGEVEEYTVEKKYISKSGEERLAKLLVLLQRTDDGKPDFLLSFIYPIRDCKGVKDQAMEEALKLLASLDFGKTIEVNNTSEPTAVTSERIKSEDNKLSEIISLIKWIIVAAIAAGLIASGMDYFSASSGDREIKIQKSD